MKNSDIVGITTQIVNNVGYPSKGFFNMDYPILFVKQSIELLEFTLILQHDIRKWDDYPSLIVKQLQTL